MSTPLIFFGIFLFACATAIITVWGMRKSYFQKQTLTNMLLSKASDKVMHYLKSHDSISELQMRELVKGLKAGEFGSRQQAVVQADQNFTHQLIEAMIHDGLIEQVQKGRQIYRAVRSKS